ncbi:hypothetical protein ACMFMG_011511 [Clarireedia jacksonii]
MLLDPSDFSNINPHDQTNFPQRQTQNSIARYFRSIYTAWMISTTFETHNHPRQPQQPTTCTSYSSPRLSLTNLRHFLFHSFITFSSFCASLHILAASRFAGLSSLGSLNKLTTLNNIVSGVCTGVHRSAADSYPYTSSPGACRIDIQSTPVEG